MLEDELKEKRKLSEIYIEKMNKILEIIEE